jgi:hypothetical protein
MNSATFPVRPRRSCGISEQLRHLDETCRWLERRGCRIEGFAGGTLHACAVITVKGDGRVKALFEERCERISYRHSGDTRREVWEAREAINQVRVRWEVSCAV